MVGFHFTPTAPPCTVETLPAHACCVYDIIFFQRGVSQFAQEWSCSQSETKPPWQDLIFCTPVECERRLCVKKRQICNRIIGVWTHPHFHKDLNTSRYATQDTFKCVLRSDLSARIQLLLKQLTTSNKVGCFNLCTSETIPQCYWGNSGGCAFAVCSLLIETLQAFWKPWEIFD